MFKAPFKLALLIFWVGSCCIAARLFKALGRIPARDRVVCLCYQGILRIIGLRLKVTGHIAEVRPLMMVSNHLSYLDVAILGSVHAVRFTPKSEIEKWPAIGWICRMCDSVFIDRRPGQLKDMADTMKATLASGAVVSLFPEATTGNGLHRLPFRSSFFSLAEESIDGRELVIQPAAIIYTRLRRLPIDSVQWPMIAWYGDMELAPHLMKLLRLGSINAELALLPPVTLSQFGDRKALAAHCEKVIAEAIEASRHERIGPSQKRPVSLAAIFSKSKS